MKNKPSVSLMWVTIYLMFKIYISQMSPTLKEVLNVATQIHNIPKFRFKFYFFLTQEWKQYLVSKNKVL